MTANIQARSLLARRLAIATVTPLALLLVLGAILTGVIVRLSDDARWVDHSDQVLAAANDTYRQIIDGETAVRGYLITEDNAFLEPLNRAHPDEGFTRLHALVADNPAQQTRFDAARARYGIWRGAIRDVLEHDLAPAKTAQSMRGRKAQMDEIRDVLGQAIAAEDGLRRTRVEASAASTAPTKWISLLLFGGCAALLAFLSRRQLRSIADSFAATTDAATTARETLEDEAWVRAGTAKLTDAMQGERTVEQLCSDSLGALAPYAGAEVGAFFTNEGGAWRRRAGYGLDSRVGGADSFALGEGLIGRVAADGQLAHLRDVPREFLKIRSGMGEVSPLEVVVVPALVDGVTNAVMELGFLRAVDARTLEMLARIGERLAMAVRSSEYKQKLRLLLEESQRQAEQLQAQEEALRATNEELEAQTTALHITQTELEAQQAELEATNNHLVEQARILEDRNNELADKQVELARRASEVEKASEYKSEFLSNMSHELRTPLNSSLILAKLLADNKDGNLSDEQVKFAETIYSAGNDLLTLINDILDLSKIEAGKMDIHAATTTIAGVRGSLMRTFERGASEKGLRFDVTVESSVPTTLETDGQRLDQILKNLISNALKFTERGEVVVEITSVADRIAFAVRDTGIGIRGGQQEVIFEAFRQADGTTNRKFGGTGLGLSISRELAHLLGGELSVSSEFDKGSTFTLTLPRLYAGPLSREGAAASSPQPASSEPPARAPSSTMPVTADSGELVAPGQRVVLVVEDDESFAQILTEVGRESGFHCLVAATAQRGFEFAKRHAPIGILLDLGLPDHGGLSVLDRLKRDPATRHIPVHIMSASDDAGTALAMGAAAYSVKPIKREQVVEAFGALEARSKHRLRRVLVVEDDEVLRASVATLLARDDVEISTAATVSAALVLLRERTFDCVVTDLTLPDQSGFELLETMATAARYSMPPVIVYTGRSLSAAEEQRLRKYSKSIIVKGARSPERLLDEVTLFLHQVESELRPDQQRLLKQARHREAVFEGRTILVAEDDVRNLFALTSALEPRGARVAIARNGREALAVLEREPGIDLILMDVMMPEMDGLEATREIRKNPRWAKLPIIALTAKAMRDDQERCLAAGANDYLAKPLDVDTLLSLLRVWMPKS